VIGRWKVAALAAITLASACQEDGPTGIVVEVTSDLATPADLELRLRVLDQDRRVLRDVSFRGAQLPGRLSILAGDGQQGPVTVEASAALSPPLLRRATVAFRPGAMVLLRMALLARCVCVSCQGDDTCDEDGVCAGPVKDPAALPLYKPRSQLDAAPGNESIPMCPRDGGAPDKDAGGDLPPVGDGMIDTARPDAAHDGAAADGGTPDRMVDAPIDAPTPNTDLPVVVPDATVDLPVVPPDTAPPPPDTAPPPPDTAPPPPDTAPPPPDTAPPPPDTAPPLDTAPPPDLGGRPQGTACSANEQCQSNACVDGVCCQSSCTAACFACSASKTGVPSGQCAPALTGTDPDGDCASDAPSSCLYDGMCNGAGGCRLYGTTTVCVAATCQGATFTPDRMCSGSGSCAPPAPQGCGFYLCTSGGCPQTCQSHSGCISTAYCNGTSCLEKKAALAPCSAGYECLSGSCVLLACL
jgi:hypothetical protein